MSSKNLLNEAQVRQFMKLANLAPLTPGFVNGLTERGSKAGDEGSVAAGKKGDTDYSGDGEREGDESKTHAGKDLEEGQEEELDETHGRGIADPAYEGRRKIHEEDDDLTAELGATEDELGAADALADEEGDEVEDLEGAELADEGEGRMVSVDDFLAALETALETAMGDEVEVDATEMEPDLEADDAEAGPDDFAPEGDEVVAGELDAELEEGVFGGGREKKWDRIAKGLDPSSDPAPHGEEEESAAATFKAQAGTETQAQQDKRAGKRRPRRDHSALAGSWKPVVQEGAAADDLVEQITKRVAARILKSALAKK